MIKYEAFNEEVFKLIPKNGKSLLDIGCGSGGLLKNVKEKYTYERLVGITHSEEESYEVKKMGAEALVADINSFNFLSLNEKFDVIVLSHVLEHLVNPWDVLERVSKILNKDGCLIIALPNVLFYKQRMQFIKGRFQYSLEGGLMDITHLRFFDYSGAKSILSRINGLTKDEFYTTGNFPLGIFRSLMPGIAKVIDNFMVGYLPGLFGFQFILKAKKESND